jgi:hypothetical protein
MPVGDGGRPRFFGFCMGIATTPMAKKQIFWHSPLTERLFYATNNSIMSDKLLIGKLRIAKLTGAEVTITLALDDKP